MKRMVSVRWILATLSLSVLLSSIGTSIANVSLPTLAQVFGASFQQVQWVVLAYLLAVATMVVSVGRLGDMVGRRRLLMIGVLLFTTASALGGIAPTLWFLIAARAVQGLGAAIMMALTMAFVGETVPQARVGRAMGLLGTMSAAGTALGPSVGGLLISAFGWQAIFLINLPLGLTILSLIHRYLPADAKRRQVIQPGFDVMGTMLLAATIAVYALAMTVGRGQFGSRNIGLLVAALLGLGLFIVAERRAESPLVRLALFRNASLSTGLP
jgi:MFS family permease